MSAESSTPESPQAEIPQVYGETFAVVYSNWIQAGRTPWDIALVFGQIRETSPGNPAIVHLVNVVMTPQMAKALIGTLRVTVRDYEKDNGEITFPESIKRKTASLSPSPSASPSPEPPGEES
jgi:hypothetical protein